MTYLNNTAKAVRDIEATGLSHEQAEAIVAAIADAGDQIATKSDTDSLKSNIDSLKVYIRYHVLIGAGIVIAGLKALEYPGV